MEHYGNKLKMLRAERGVTQEVYADMMNRSQNAVSSIERNVCPTLENIILYLDVLPEPKVKLYEFFMTESDIKEITGVDPQWIKIGKTIEHMPEDVQNQIMFQILSILDMMIKTLETYEQNMMKSLAERKSRSDVQAS